MSCEDCKFIKDEMSGKPPDCIACGFVKVIPENYEVMNIIESYMRFMVDGMGSINLVAILEVFKMIDISENRHTLLLKILTYISSAIKTKTEGTTFSKGKAKATKKVSHKGTTETYRG